jgi:hypothetical protein
VHNKARIQLAIAMLVAAKIFGIAGLILGATQYRLVGGALLAFDGLLLGAAFVLGLRIVKTHVVEEKDDKRLLQKMMEEGTLDQYLRDLREPRSRSRSPGGGGAGRDGEESRPSLC